MFPINLEVFCLLYPSATLPLLYTKAVTFSITKNYYLPFINVFGNHNELICFYQDYHYCQIRWYRFLISALERQRHMATCEFEASLVYTGRTFSDFFVTSSSTTLISTHHTHFHEVWNTKAVQGHSSVDVMVSLAALRSTILGQGWSSVAEYLLGCIRH